MSVRSLKLISFFLFKNYLSDVAGLLKKYVPDTFACEDVLHTDEYGPLPVAKAKGEGGRSDLATRLGDNFYNQYQRYFIQHSFCLQYTL